MEYNDIVARGAWHIVFSLLTKHSNDADSQNTNILVDAYDDYLGCLPFTERMQAPPLSMILGVTQQRNTMLPRYMDTMCPSQPNEALPLLSNTSTNTAAAAGGVMHTVLPYKCKINRDKVRSCGSEKIQSSSVCTRKNIFVQHPEGILSPLPCTFLHEYKPKKDKEKVRSCEGKMVSHGRLCPGKNISSQLPDAQTLPCWRLHRTWCDRIGVDYTDSIIANQDAAGFHRIVMKKAKEYNISASDKKEVMRRLFFRFFVFPFAIRKNKHTHTHTFMSLSLLLFLIKFLVCLACICVSECKIGGGAQAKYHSQRKEKD